MQPSPPIYILISGLPASGKSTLANQLQASLGLSLLDKDTILEQLYVAFRSTNAEQRRHVSSSADQVFVAIAKQLGRGILCTFWDHPASTTTPGTDTQWLRTSAAQVIEVYCHCPAETAFERIQIRQQKQGAQDNNRANLGYDLLSEYKIEASLGPLNLGKLITVKTDQPVKLELLTQQIIDLINTKESI
ncbi:MAG TPA: ATP-binding protein [Oceanospirillaceae bacterium]|jgi:hypothetical protein|nr:ATP-binding protein [Oceanospirillaceae bacterium]